MQLITASVDTRIRIFDLSATASRTSGNQKPEAVLEGHVSVPRGLDVSLDGNWLVSGGRDSVVLIWNLSPNSSRTKSNSNKGKGNERVPLPTLAKTIPVSERVEGVGFLCPDENPAGSSSAPGKIRFYTGGEKGVVKIWDGRDGTVLFTLGQEDDNISDDREEQRQIVDTM
jgi:U3 small nucleolar RNA-associated protein 13